MGCYLVVCRVVARLLQLLNELLAVFPGIVGWGGGGHT
jgi:hypothetical protein